MNIYKYARTTPYARALIVEKHADCKAYVAIKTALGDSARSTYKSLTR